MAGKKDKIESVGLQSKIDELNKKYGTGSVMTLNEKNQGDYEVIPTGSLGFDTVVLGVGGFVKGKLYELRGWEGSGKSSICGHLAAEAQKAYPNQKVLYIDGEFALDKIYFSSLGVDVNELLISQPSNGEEGFTIAQELISSGEISLCIIDSDSSLLPKSVLEGDMGNSNIGKKAKLNSDAYPKLKGLLSKNNTCVVVVSQYRMQIGMMFGDPKITQGGKALGFYADCIIEVTKKLRKEDDVTSGNITTVKTIKNKTNSPFKTATFDIIFGIGIDKMGELMEMGDKYEILRKWGKDITFDGTKYNVEVFNSLLQDNQEFKEDLINKIKEKINGDKVEEITLVSADTEIAD